MKVYKLVLWVIVIVGIAYFLGAKLSSKIEYKTEQVEVIKEIEVEAPVLSRIAKCESGNNHYAKSGQVLVVGNNNKSVDVGKYQINAQIWGAKATELKLNIFIEKDNEEFAKYLYRTYGTEPWVWSKKCWSK
jgi:hypothetical protein